METERPHRTTSGSGSSSNSTTSELFICFTSRLSSSSMKISSKSILSPGRNREPSSLSSSLSRRLRTNGSIRSGQASPMFPSIGKKRGSALENPEPSSPKVTCIGQVRVKTKKQGKKIRARSKRRGEMSFRKIEGGAAAAMAAAPSSNSFEMGSHQDYNMGHFLHSSSHHYQQNQHQECRKWVHFPVTICEALRTFGAEFNCFLPCRSSCMSNQREKEEKAAGSDGDINRSGCGAVFGRWLMVEGKEREIELVVGEEEEERRGSSEMRKSQRRHIFEDIEIKDEKMGEEEARVSICVPPKNALLLMRCRSDPVKMAALANRFWESPAQPKDENGEKEDGNEEHEKVEEEEEELPIVDEHEMEHEMVVVCRKSVSFEVAENTEIIPVTEAELEPESETESPLDGGEVEPEEQEIDESNVLSEKFEDGNIECKKGGIEMENQLESESTEKSSLEFPADPETAAECEEINCISPESEENSEEELVPAKESEKEKDDYEEAILNEEEFVENNKEQEAETEETGETEEEEEEDEETVTRERSEPVTQKPGSNEKESQQKILPDCLLLMMCEPKLSMEVSKETWVCSTDFIRWLPKRPAPLPTATKKKNSGGDEPKRRISFDSKPSPKSFQPPRASISFPVAPPMFVAAAAQAPGGASMGTMIEQKLVGGKGYEPFVLKRCKSEPMRSAAKLSQVPVPDGGCFWKNRKMEPATLGVGAAGVGF